MDLDGGAAVGAGLIGGAVMAMLLYMGIGMVPRQMHPLVKSGEIIPRGPSPSTIHR